YCLNRLCYSFHFHRSFVFRLCFKPCWYYDCSRHGFCCTYCPSPNICCCGLRSTTGLWSSTNCHQASQPLLCRRKGCFQPHCCLWRVRSFGL
ncbi:hypothetical protein HDU99_009134, partial [Rhizoclosmatium hyalinum]